MDIFATLQEFLLLHGRRRDFPTPAIPLLEEFPYPANTPLAGQAPAVNPLGLVWSSDDTGFTANGAGKAAAKHATNGVVCTNWIDLGAADVELEAQLTAPNVSAGYLSGLILRYADPGNYLRVVFPVVDSPSDNLRLEKVEGGAASVLGKAYSPYFQKLPYQIDLAGAYTVRVRAVGTEVRLAIAKAGQEEIALAVAGVAFNRTATRHGLLGTNRTSGTASTLADYFYARPPAPLSFGEASFQLTADPDKLYLISGLHPSAGGERAAVAKDLSGRGNPAYQPAAAKAPQFYPNIINGSGALKFNSTDGTALYAEANFDPALGFTLAAYFQLNPITSADAHTDLFRVTDGSGNDRMQFQLFKGVPDRSAHLIYTLGGANVFDFATGMTDDGAWHKLVWTFDWAGRTSTAWIDGAQAAHFNGVSPWSSVPVVLHIGEGGFSYSVNAHLRDFRTYNYPVASAQAAAIAAAMG